MSEHGPFSSQPSQAAQWAALVVALAVIAATVVVVVRGPAAGPDNPLDGTGSGSTPSASGTSPPSSPSAGPSADPAEPRDPAAAVLASIEPGEAASRSGVAARLRPLLASPAVGPRLGAVVLDPATDEFLLEIEAAGTYIPASTTKLLTALATLETLGPDTRFRTTVIQTDGQVVLVGGGDPVLSQRVAAAETWDYPFTPLDRLARAAADELLATGTSTVRLGYADDLFSGPAVNPAWEPGYVPAGQVAPVSALSLDGGRTRPGFAPRAGDPAQFAADRFAALLGAYGVRVDGAPTPQGTPAGGLVAAVESPTVAEIVGQMLARSDNDVAEMLARHVARAEGAEPTFAGGGRAIAAVVDRLGVPTTGLLLRDGSGLSRQNRISAATLARTLEVAYEDEDGSSRSLLTGLPVAGFTGSLGNRFADPESRPEAGDIRAKTGYLNRVVTLAGYVVDDDGRPLIFVVLADAIEPASTLEAQRTIDQMAARLAGCGCS